MAFQQIAGIKKNSRCKTCGQLRHKYSDHNQNGRLKPWVKTSESAPVHVAKKPRALQSKCALQKESINFNKVSIRNDRKFSFNRIIQGVTKKLTKNTEISDPNDRDLVHKFTAI